LARCFPGSGPTLNRQDSPERRADRLFSVGHLQQPVTMYSEFQLDEVSESVSVSSRFVLLGRVLLAISGIGVLSWTITTNRFRDLEGFPSGTICLPVAVGVALLILAAGLNANWRRATFFFSLALVGQAVSLQLIEAGHRIKFQHYKPIGRLVTETHSLILLFLALQAVLVVSSIWQHRSEIFAWLTKNFRGWHLVVIGLVFVVSAAGVQREFANYLADLLVATVIQTVNLVNLFVIAWLLPSNALRKFAVRANGLLEADSGKEKGIDRFVLLAASWVVLLAALLSFFVYQHHPHVPDEVFYFYQARYFAAGRLSKLAPRVPEAFSFSMVPWESGRWYSIFSPGWPAVLAVGFLLGAGWLVNPL